MQRNPLFALASGLLTFAFTCAIDPAAAFAYSISTPVVHGNLAVYPVEGGGPGGSSLLTLEQAMRQGGVKIHEMENAQIEIENLSGHGIFLQAGTLLQGGLQDQVVTTTTIVPPGSGRVPIGTYCVDPWRSTARSSDDAKLFTSTGALFPWTAARLSLATPVPSSKPVLNLRQTGVWWSIDTLRSRLEQRLGEAVEPPRIPQWTRDESLESRARVQLAARRSSWTTSLPLALQNRRLAQAQQPYVNALKRVGARSNVIGVVYAVNGRFYAADLYGSHDLFRRMWPALAQAYATEAIAMDGETAQPLPSAAAAKAFLEAALKEENRRDGQAAQEPADSRVVVRDTEAALSAETIARDGRWVHRGIVAKLDPAAATRTPEALAVRILESGRVNDIAVADLGGDETVVLRRGEQDLWTADVPGHTVQMLHVNSAEVPQLPEFERLQALIAAASTRSGRGISPTMLVPAICAVLLLLAAMALVRRRPRRPHREPAAVAPKGATSAVDAPAEPDYAPVAPIVLRPRDSTRRLRNFRRRRFAARAMSMGPTRPAPGLPEGPLAA